MSHIRQKYFSGYVNILRTIFLFYFIGFTLAAHADDIRWDESTIVSADIDCDSLMDKAKLGFIENSVRLSVTFAASGLTQSIEFGLGDSDYQGSLCGTDPILSVTDMDYDLIEIFGKNPDGFEQSQTCKGLDIHAGDCDAMHIFWNHKTKHINWWRL